MCFLLTLGAHGVSSAECVLRSCAQPPLTAIAISSGLIPPRLQQSVPGSGSPPQDGRDASCLAPQFWVPRLRKQTRCQCFSGSRGNGTLRQAPARRLHRAAVFFASGRPEVPFSQSISRPLTKDLGTDSSTGSPRYVSRAWGWGKSPAASARGAYQQGS